MKKTTLLAAILLVGIISCTSQSADKKTETNTSPTAQAAPYQDLTVAEFKQKMTEPDVVVLDVRTPEETAEGKIEGATELDFQSPDFAAQLDKMDKSKTYLVYCRSGNRSGKTCELMSEKGFAKFYNLAGGYTAWTTE